MSYNSLTQRELMNEEFFAIEDQHQLEEKQMRYHRKNHKCTKLCKVFILWIVILFEVIR
jgi:hypothetical protein